MNSNEDIEQSRPNVQKKEHIIEVVNSHAASSEQTQHCATIICPNASQSADSLVSATKSQVFLGGSCNPTTWRQKIAMPFLDTEAITYFNPQVDDWKPDMINLESVAKENADILFFVIDCQTRSTVGLIESAFIAGSNKSLVIVLYPFEQNPSVQSSSVSESSIAKHNAQSVECQTTKACDQIQSNCPSSSKISQITLSSMLINNEYLTLNECKLLKQARYFLRALVSSKKLPIFHDINQALLHVKKCLGDRSNPSLSDSNNSDICNLDNKEDDQIGEKESLPRSKLDKVSLDKSLRDIYLFLDFDDANVDESPLVQEIQKLGLSLYLNESLQDLYEGKCKIEFVENAIRADSQASECKKHLSFQKVPNDELELRTKFYVEHQFDAMKKSQVLLFVISNNCRALSVMILAAYCISLKCHDIVICIQYLEDPCLIGNEMLSKTAINDYNRGRVYLCDHAVKSKVPVFSDIDEALACCTEKCRK